VVRVDEMTEITFPINFTEEQLTLSDRDQGSRFTTTFVTAFIDLQENRGAEKKHDDYLLLFRKLAATGIPICLYLSACFETSIQEICQEHPNVKIMKIMNLEDTWTSKTVNILHPELPEHRNVDKDTLNYMITMNAKIEYLQDTVKENPFNTSHFAWIDFGIFHVLHLEEIAVRTLQRIATSKLLDKLLILPGCWSKGDRKEFIAATIHWRFCGGFFIGDKQSILDMWHIYMMMLIRFIQQHKKLAWEVNIWAYMELYSDWSPSWYYAAHDDGIIKLPEEVFAMSFIDKLPPKCESVVAWDKREDKVFCNWNVDASKMRNIEGVNAARNIGGVNADSNEDLSEPNEDLFEPDYISHTPGYYKYIMTLDHWHFKDYNIQVFLSGTVVLMVEDNHYNYWYRKYLIPFIHYIPIKKDYSNLDYWVAWLKSNDKLAREIAGNNANLRYSLFSPDFKRNN
jgi:hypothetical protein